MQITQSALRNKIEALSKDEEWGAPFFYDLKVIKKGEGVKTEYEINPVPHRPVDKTIIVAYALKQCYLDALFDGADPFDTCWTEHTPGVFSPSNEALNEE